jgi:hypothetical protein
MFADHGAALKVERGKRRVPKREAILNPARLRVLCCRPSERIWRSSPVKFCLVSYATLTTEV